MSLYNKIIDLQKLGMAWERVKKNKPAAGVDQVTYEQFDTNKREELKQLQIELQNHTYQALPVRRVMIYKGEKAREIALYAMRDKVVQQSVAAELNRIYEACFSECTYAYRSNRAALQAVEDIGKQIETKTYEFIVKADIAHFFDTINFSTLKRMLEKKILEEDVLKLIEENTRSVMLDDTGELIEKRCGIYQGSGISPILSNIYLLEFDHWLSGQDVFYVRYSDDMLLLGKNREKMLELLRQMRLHLEVLGLQLNDEKTVCVSAAEGVNFLGYHFSDTGKTIPARAEESLKERLELMWLTSADIGFEEKLKKALEIIGGWEQYFREQRAIGSVFEYVALIYGARYKDDYRNELRELRPSVDNIYRDILEYLAAVWQENADAEMELLEYEQYYQIYDVKSHGMNMDFAEELLENYRKLMVLEDADAMTELMQTYTDRGEFEKAAFWMQKRQNVQEQRAQVDSTAMVEPDRNRQAKRQVNRRIAQKVWKLFVGREDLYSKESIGYGGKRDTEHVALPLTEHEVYQHMCGEMTVGTYVQRPNSTVKYLVIDTDVSKKVMLQCGREGELFSTYLKKAFQKAQEVRRIFQSFGMESYIEYSGCRGYHVWLFFTEWIPVRYVNMLTDVLEEKLQRSETRELTDTDITIEYFPNKTRIKPGKFGQIIKLPYGRHIQTNEISYFVDESGLEVESSETFLDNLSKTSLAAVKKVLAANTGYKEWTEKKALDHDFSALGQLSANVSEILKKCNLMGFLCQKAIKMGYLTHFERLSMLYVFGHLGEDGKEFVHQIMSFTLNYQYNMTDKFLKKLPDKPISCIKLRDQYKQVTAEYGCSCSFKRNKNCYPSPVLHAISLSSDIQTDVTLPLSRTMTKEKEKQMIDEMNIYKRAQELAGKIVEMKKQRRGIDAAIQKVERELEKIYDNAGVDCLEVDMGMLVRRKKELGYEWLIEI